MSQPGELRKASNFVNLFSWHNFFMNFHEGKKCSGCQQLFHVCRQQGRHRDLSQVSLWYKMWPSYILKPIYVSLPIQRIQLRRRTSSSQRAWLLLRLKLRRLPGRKSHPCNRYWYMFNECNCKSLNVCVLCRVLEGSGMASFWLRWIIIIDPIVLGDWHLIGIVRLTLISVGKPRKIGVSG